jgi:hypothetical protein
VIPVYENSYYFQGYIAQGLKSYFSNDYAHYFFIADDLILNPTINENNYTQHLNLSTKSCFLPSFLTLHEIKDSWWTRVNEAYHYKIKTPGIEAETQLPDYNTALMAFKKFGLEIKPLTFNQIWKKPATFKEVMRRILLDKHFLIDKIKSKIFKQHYSLPYPIVGSYSDIFVVNSSTIKQFCHYCGVFAATDLFVEVGLPTAMVLSAEEIVTEKDLLLRGKPLWTENDYLILEKYDNNLNRLLDNFPDNHLYLHPIKLSRWKYKP